MKHPITKAHIAIAVTAFAVTGCSPYLHSPPGRVIASQTAKALNKGETAVQGEAGFGFGSEIALGAASLRVRHGFGKDVDVSGELTYTQLGDVDFKDAMDAVLSARAGVKYAIIDNFAIEGGVVAGGWAGGGFVSPDVKLILSKENPKFVPYLDVGAFTSHPFAKRVVEYDASDSLGPASGLAPFSFGWTVGAGFRVPVRRWIDQTNHGILFGFRYTDVRFDNPVGSNLEGRRSNEPYLTFTLGYEHVFAKKR